MTAGRAAVEPSVAREGADLSALRGRADVLGLLSRDPGAATPALVRRLKERVQELARSDARAAADLAEAAAAVAERCGDAASLALGHRAQAVAALAGGSRRLALRHYEEAERLYLGLGDEVERARVLRSSMDALMHLGRHGEALAAGVEAREIFVRHRLPVLAAQVDANAGSVLHLLQRNAESLDAYERALAAFRHAGEAEAVAMMEFNRANVFANLHRLADAERGYRRALRFYRARRWRLREAQCLYGLANAAHLGGRYGEALRLLERVGELDGELGDLRHAALCELDRAELMLALNACSETTVLADSAGKALQELGLLEEAGRAAVVLGLAALRVNRLGRAEEVLVKARDGFAARANHAAVALADLYLAELDLGRGAPLAALRRARSAARAFAGQQLAAREAYARVVAARAATALGDEAGARRQCRTALARLEVAPAATVAWQAHHLLARVSRRAGTRRDRLERAMALVEGLRAEVAPDELRASFGRDKARLFEDSAALLLEGAPPRLEEAFEAVERGKARVLGEALARRRRRGARGGAEWERELEALNACYLRSNELERQAGAAREAESLRREIAEREARLGVLLRRRQLSGGTTALANGGARALSAARPLLGQDEVLLELFALGGALHAFVVRRDRMDWVPGVARLAEVGAALDRWGFHVETLRHGVEHVRKRRRPLAEAARALLEELSERVWRPLQPALGSARELVVVPTGALFRLPFHALLQEGRHLVETVEVSQAPSTRAFVAAHGRRRPAQGRPVVLGVERPELPSIGEELAAVAERLPGARLLRGPDAGRQALRRHARGARIVHVASHAEFRADNPLLSSVELADGRLSFYDLWDVRLDADLVVLSGCRTGLHRVLEGDELMGLARGFLTAGTASLIASLWPVEDRATARFMTGFYRAVADGRGPRAALACAMRERISEDALPLEWAPFHLSGRPRWADSDPRRGT